VNTPMTAHVAGAGSAVASKAEAAGQGKKMLTPSKEPSPATGSVAAVRTQQNDPSAFTVGMRLWQVLMELLALWLSRRQWPDDQKKQALLVNSRTTKGVSVGGNAVFQDTLLEMMEMLPTTGERHRHDNCISVLLTCQICSMC
jgi:hypothetical protein